MAKTLTIRIEPAEAALEEFRKTFKDVERGRRVDRRERVYFTSIEAARNLLTPNRLALLRAVRSRRPGSIYELAKIVDRDLKNVQDDLRIMERYGLIRYGGCNALGQTPGSSPRSLFDQIELKIAI